MRTNEQFKADIIGKLVANKISKDEASKLLQKSVRSIERYTQKYNNEGVSFVFHKNKNREPANKIQDKLKKYVQFLSQSKYFDFNLAHTREKLKAEENISVSKETLRRWAHEIDCVKRKGDQEQEKEEAV